ncbi:metallophosphoesterase [Fusibacter sp. JL216-2]|uniref:metallophosphoesterase n=1 Tax=Fusibacter sp. JL216-2 TaxID=3071453 RepID=UPI003D32B4EA
MRIGVMSDTHGELELAREAIRQMGKVDLILHAGDTYQDLEKLSEDTKIEMIGVRGNIGSSDQGPAELVLELGDYRIFLVHGHHYDVKHSLMRLFYRAKELEIDVVVYGHTHVALSAIENDVLFLNPGSIGFPRGKYKNSYGILDLSGKKVKAEILEIV